MHSAETWRLFVAIPLPGPVRREIESLQIAWRSALPPRTIRWTHCEQLHLTLKFLGDVATDQVQALTTALEGASRPQAPLRLVTQGAGVFPNEHSPRVLWVGVRDLDGRLAALQQEVETAVAGFVRSEPAGPFTGHVTLGRVREGARSIAGVIKDLVAAAARRKFGEWTATAMDLMRSELSPAGARHTRVAELPLGRNPQAPER